MKNVWEEAKETINSINRIKVPNQWTIDVVDSYIQGLFSFAKFKVGDQVEMANTYPVSQEESWGWWAYRHLLVRGSKAKVENVDWRDGHFVYYIKFNENSWTDSDNKINQMTGNNELGCFCLSEKWLTDKVDVE